MKRWSDRKPERDNRSVKNKTPKLIEWKMKTEDISATDTQLKPMFENATGAADYTPVICSAELHRRDYTIIGEKRGSNKKNMYILVILNRNR